MTALLQIQNFHDLRAVLFSSMPLKDLQEKLRITEDWTMRSIVEWLQEEIRSPKVDGWYQKRCTRYLNTIVKKHQVFPSSFFCNDISRDGDYPLGGGGFADVYKGILESRPVCLKVLRVHTQADEERRRKMVENFCQEALIWTQLSHSNVLQLLGVNTTLFKTDFCLVSPWMVNGDIISFLEKNPHHDRLRSIKEIAAGLKYLHSRSPTIVHGDIKGANILVDEDFTCRLADFGLSVEASGTTLIETSTGSTRGSVRWMAPEAFETSAPRDPKEDQSPLDIYAYACTVYEIMTGSPPFPDLLEVAVITQVHFNGSRPERPTGNDVWCPDDVWGLVEKCWDQDRLKRPTANHAYNFLQLVDFARTEPPDVDADSSPPSTLSSNQKPAIDVPGVSPQPTEENNSPSTQPTSGRVFELPPKVASTAAARDSVTSSAPNPPEPVQETTSPAALESYKVSMDDPTRKVLPAALKKYKLDPRNWRDYAMFIVYGSADNRIERVLSYDEKPLLLFQKLKDSEKNPVFMLKHVKDIRSPLTVARQKQAK